MAEAGRIKSTRRTRRRSAVQGRNQDNQTRRLIAPSPTFGHSSLRNRRFFSLAELNQAIRELLETLNGRVTKHLGASRRQLFEALDCPALQPLPAQAYQYAEWKQRRAGLDYHVEVAKHYYSVPHALAKQKLWARITERTVEAFHKGRRVAAHMRGSGNRRHTTVAEHMPSAHRRYASWTLERIRREATANGTDTEALIDRILRTRPPSFSELFAELFVQDRYCLSFADKGDGHRRGRDGAAIAVAVAVR